MGYAVIAIDYRLDPLLNGPHTLADQLQAAANAIADAQESVRWLKAHAATYGIDTTRIAAVGDSAGGAIALGLSAVPDSHPTSPYSAYSPSVAAAVSTGAYLTPGLEAGLLHLTGHEAPDPHVPLRDRRGQRARVRTPTRPAPTTTRPGTPATT